MEDWKYGRLEETLTNSKIKFYKINQMRMVVRELGFSLPYFHTPILPYL
jgi:hypothetical protein